MNEKKFKIKFNDISCCSCFFGISSGCDCTGTSTPKKLEDAINSGYIYANPLFGAVDIVADQGSYFGVDWQYLDSEWDNGIFAQPIDFNLYINGHEVKLQRSATGYGLSTCFGGQFGEDCKGPIYHWYAIFAPNTFDPSVLNFDVEVTSSTNYAYISGEVFVW